MNESDLYDIAVADLTVDPRIQRPLDARRVNKIAEELNFDALGVPTVSRRSNGDHVVIDGQHRLAALRQAGHASEKITCRVFKGLELPAEAAMFRLLNNTAKPQYIDTFRVRVIERDPDAVAISRMAERHGWTVNGFAGRPGSLMAIQAFERIYQLDDVAAEQTLMTVTRAWGVEDPGAADGRILEGIGLVLARYGAAVEVDDLIERLARFPGGPGALLGRARGLRDLIGSTVTRAVAEIVVETYNRRRKTKALPPWRSA